MKGTANVIGGVIAAVLFILALPFIWLYEQVGGQLFMVIVFGVPILIWAFIDWRKSKRAPQETAAEAKARKKLAAEAFHADNLKNIQEREQATHRVRVHTVERVVDDHVEVEVHWTRQLEEIKRAWGEGDFEFARTWLQKLAYRLTAEQAPEEIHSQFKTLMVAFTRDDPLYADVMRVALPAIAAAPGIVQSVLAKQFPQFDAEQFRYAMYYGAEIGDVVREKKGRSYSLRLTAAESNPVMEVAMPSDSPSKTIQINTEEAAELLYGLFQGNTWLLSVSPVRHDDAEVEHQALRFILDVAEQGVRDWGQASQAVKETVSLLMMDFLAKLMHPQSPFANRTWLVDAEALPLEQSLQVVAEEIRRAHPRFARH